MIEIIKVHIQMPPLPERRYQLDSLLYSKWIVLDTKKNRIRYKGTFEMCAIISHNLNKKYYTKNKYFHYKK